MFFAFEKFERGKCCLCGVRGADTGEHKIKASQIKGQFEGRPTLLVRNEEGVRPKLAQSPKSRVFHFDAKICKKCNSARLQKADRAFDIYNEEIQACIRSGQGLIQISDGVVVPANRSQLDYFRFFAKQLCCFLAEVGGPRPVEVANFAIGRSNQNHILLNTQLDDTYQRARKEIGEFSYAAHGGLKCWFDDRRLFVRSIESSLSIGGVEYRFGISLNLRAKIELQLRHNEFVRQVRRVSYRE